MVDHDVDDPAGDGNGYLDAGEAGELRVELLNFGEQAGGITGTLSTLDPWAQVAQPEASFGELDTGESFINSGEPFLVEALPGAPFGHPAEMILTLSSDAGVQESRFTLSLGRKHFLVWDPTPDQSSGPTMTQTLLDAGYSGYLSATLPAAAGLDRFMTLWISLGVYPNNRIIGDSSLDALSILEYLDSGGRCYLEGGNAWYYDPTIGGHEMRNVFSIHSPHDGGGSIGPVGGVAGEFTEGMNFDYVGENNFMDPLFPTSSSVQILKNGFPIHADAVAYDAGAYRTVGTCFEFAGLVDGPAPSTKSDWARGVMDFFLDAPTGLETPTTRRSLSAWPNPFNPATEIRFVLEEPGSATLDIHDTKGRRLRQLHRGRLEAGEHGFVWDGRDEAGHRLGSGLYLARLSGTGEVRFAKLILLK